MRRNDISNISSGFYEKQFQIKGRNCSIILEDAQYGDYKGQKELLDKTIVDDMFKDIAKVLANSCTKYNDIPSVVSISHGNETKEIDAKKELYQVMEPDETIDEVILSDEVKKQIDIVLAAINNQKRLVEEWELSGVGLDNRALVLNFYGAPGTGKSMCARAIATKLNRKLIQVNYSELESKYVGETPKNITNVFREAKENDAVLVFDEADSFLSKRLTNITQAADYGVNITRSVMLMELERFEGIVVFTTNLIANYDTAFKRRILASIRFELPDVNARQKIWKLHLHKMPLKDISVEELAEKFEGISGADIKDIIYYAALIALQDNKEQVELLDFQKAYEYVVARYDVDDGEEK